MGESSGTLTFLFTDIVGHTSLWDMDAESMSVVLHDHDDLLTQTVGASGGTVVKHTGDGAMATFPDADHAVDAAVAFQRHLAGREWPGVGRLGVRVGLHTGVADLRDGDFFGPDVIRASRLCDAGHGGQVLASRAVVELARSHQWLGLGAHRLAGLREPVEVHQVVADGLVEEFPALRTASSRTDDLPSFRTTFFGREHEVEELADLLRAQRLVTLTGVGGTGKTRLAVAVAHEAAPHFPDGVCFVDLSVVTDPTRIWDAVASALALASSMGVSSETTRRDAVVEYLGGRGALLVLDNCEHLLDGVADTVEDLLEETAEVVVLATSREGLHVEGERLVQVPSLPVDSTAVELLQDRAAASGSPPLDHELAVEICERLDGLPLGIELVAARCGQLGAAEVAGRLSDRFRLVTGSRRRVSRQRTLEATLDWSYELLDEAERSVLRRLSVLTGGGSLAAMEAVTGAGAHLVASLVEKSLVDRRGDGRFHMLETVRAYAEDRLVEAGEADSTRQALADWLLERFEAEPIEELYAGTSGLVAFVAGELDNLYASLDWAAARSDCELVVRLATPVALSMWEAADATLRPVSAHIRACLDAGIEGDLRHVALAAEILSGWIGERRGDLVLEVGDVPPDRDDALAVIRLCHAGMLLEAWGRLRSDRGTIDQGRGMLERAATIGVGHGAVIRAIPTYYQAIGVMGVTDWEGAARLFDDAVRILDRPPRFFEWHAHATARLGAGRPFDRAELDVPDGWGRTAEHLPGGIDVHIDAVCAHAPERPRTPVSLDRQDLDRFLAGRSLWVRNLLIAVAQLASREEDWPTAAVLLAAAKGELERDIFASPAGFSLYRLTVTPVREALAKDARHALVKEGRQMDLAAGLDLAVEWLALEPRPPDPAGTTGT